MSQITSKAQNNEVIQGTICFHGHNFTSEYCISLLLACFPGQSTAEENSSGQGAKYWQGLVLWRSLLLINKQSAGRKSGCS